MNIALYRTGHITDDSRVAAKVTAAESTGKSINASQQPDGTEFTEQNLNCESSNTKFIIFYLIKLICSHLTIATKKIPASFIWSRINYSSKHSRQNKLSRSWF